MKGDEVEALRGSDQLHPLEEFYQGQGIWRWLNLQGQDLNWRESICKGIGFAVAENIKGQGQDEGRDFDEGVLNKGILNLALEEFKEQYQLNLKGEGL